MPLTKETIKEAVDRYWREYDRYLKLAKRVEELCRSQVVEGNAIRAQVTFRAKDPKRFEAKLEKYLVDEDEKAWVDGVTGVDDVFVRVGDLAGVRVATYEERDRPEVVKAINKVFVGVAGADVDVDPKDRDGSFYRATHCQVYLPDDELVGTYENLRELGCEIQVSSMLAHVWNEIEHDLRYKPQMGKPSDREHELLTELGQLLSAGDTVIKHLLEEAEKRQKEDTEPFADVFDFVARLREYLSAIPELGRNAGQLFDELIGLEYDSPRKIKDDLIPADQIEPARELLNEFLDWLTQNDEPTMALDEGSSDVLLVHLLAQRVDDVLARHPLGPGKGRPSRLVSLALRFKKHRAQLAQQQNPQPPQPQPEPAAPADLGGPPAGGANVPAAGGSD